MQGGWQAPDGGDIVHDGMYANFDLRLEWKIATAGNSGVMFYVQEGKQYQYPWQTGIESQVLDNVAGDDAKYDRHRAGDLYELVAGKPEAVRPANEWNRLEIISDHGHLVEKLNGTVVLETTLWDAWSVLGASLASKGYREIFEGLAKIGPQLAAFFDKGGVMVMDPKPELRENRLALLHAIYDPFVKIGDFRKLGGAS